MNELVKTLQARIKLLEQELARYENARVVGAIEVGYWRSRALGDDPLDVNSHHPDSELGKLLQVASTRGVSFGTPTGQAQT
jgi:hypothetical protein